MIHFNVFSTALPVKAILPCLVLLTIFASATVGADTSSAACSIYVYTAPLMCDYKVQREDLDGSCGAADHPCIAGKKGITWGHAECDKCYKVTYTRDLIDDWVCNDCEGYTRQVYIKVVDANYQESDYGIGQDGFLALCPYLCYGTEFCVTDPSVCTHGVNPDNGGQRGACYTTIPITVEEVVCGSPGDDDDEEKPTEAPQPTETADEKPTETADEKPTETADENPTETADEKPTETVDENPTETVDENPTETVDEKPTETADENPTETADEKPTETADEKPTETADEKPTETADENPTETADEKPTETADEKPTETADEKPTETADEKPTETADEKPTETVDEKPTETEDEAADESVGITLRGSAIGTLFASLTIPLVLWLA